MVLFIILFNSDIEIGDIGSKGGLNAMDNGYLAFRNYRFPRFNMLMNFAQVSRNGRFTRTGSELLMYASVLIMRSMLCIYAPLSLSIGLTIAIRYRLIAT